MPTNQKRRRLARKYRGHLHNDLKSCSVAASGSGVFYSCAARDADANEISTRIRRSPRLSVNIVPPTGCCTMQCTLTTIGRIVPDDIRAVAQHLDRNTDQLASHRHSPVSTAPSSSTGLVAHDANDQLTDESEEPELNRQIWPTGGESVSLGNINIPVIHTDLQTSDNERGSTLADDRAARWLRSSLISATPKLDLIATAAVRSVAILERSGSSKRAESRLQLTSQFTIDVEPKSAYITSILALPLASTRRTAVSAVDSVAILVGVSTGELLVFTASGVLVFCERVAHDVAVTQLRLGGSVSGQRVVAVAANRAAFLDGASLHSILKTTRAEVARGERSAATIASEHTIAASVVELAGVSAQSPLLDVQLVNVDRPSVFSQYAASTLSRIERRAATTLRLPRAPPIVTTSLNLYAATSASIALFARYDEGVGSRNVVAETLQAVQTRVANALPSIGFRSLFGIGVSRRDRPPKTEVADAPLHRVPQQSRLADPERRFERAVAAPFGWQLVAICDERARVLLIDQRSRSIVRVWKGYRSARCAFVEALEPTDSPTSSSGRRTRALFLVIYAPKRGLLEVWTMQTGPRVAAFKVDRHGRLVSLSSPRDGTLRAAANIEMTVVSSGGAMAAGDAPTVVFLSSDGSLQTLRVPFHVAALNANATETHDDALLKECRLDALVDTDDESESTTIAQVFAQLRLTSARRRLIDRFVAVASRRLSTQRVLNTLVACRMSIQPDIDRYVEALEQLVKLHDHLATISTHHPTSSVVSSDTICDEMRDLLLLSVEDFDDLHLSLMTSSSRTSSRPALPTLSRFREHFVVEETGDRTALVRSTTVGVEEASTALWVPLLSCSDVTSQQENENETTTSTVDRAFDEMVAQVMIEPTELIRLLLTAWLGTWNSRPWTLIAQGLRLLERLADLEDAPDLHTIAVMTEQAVWTSSNATASLHLWLIVRALLQRQKMREETSTDFETLDDSTARHFVISKHLALLALFEHLFVGRSSIVLSLDQLANHGVGFYRELVGLFVAQERHDVDFIMQRIEESKDEAAQLKQTGRRERIMTAIVSQFAFSFAPALLSCDCAWELCGAWARDETRRSIDRLEMSIAFVERLVDSPRLAHGSALMLWYTFINAPLHRLYTLWADAPDGRLPRDRQLRSEVMCSDLDLLRWLDVVRRLLAVVQTALIDDRCHELIGDMPECEYEPFVVGFFSSRWLVGATTPRDRGAASQRRRPALSELALQQKVANLHLVRHHDHLVAVLWLLARLSLQTPIGAVFDITTRRPFFTELHESPFIPIADVAEPLRESRSAFLERCVEAVGVEREADSYDACWNVIEMLNSEWQLDANTLRIKEIMMLHESRCDTQAMQHYTSVESRRLLAARLMPLAVGRLRALLDADAQWRSRADRRLKPNAREAVKHVPDRWIANFEPTAEETLTLLDSVLHLHGSQTASGGEQTPAEWNRRALGDMREFMRQF